MGEKDASVYVYISAGKFNTGDKFYCRDQNALLIGHSNKSEK